MTTDSQQPQNDGKSAAKAESGKSGTKGNERNHSMETRQERHGGEGPGRNGQNPTRGGRAAATEHEPAEHREGSRNRNHFGRDRGGIDGMEARVRTELSHKGESGMERPRDDGRSQRTERGGREKGQRSERGQREAITQMDTKTIERPVQERPTPERPVQERPAQERPEKQGLPERSSRHEGNDRTRPQARILTDAQKIPKKREESAEDIRIAAESLEKDIQFEIQQIQTIKLGL